MARYHVNVVLQPPVALVQIDQAFYNPSTRQEEGTFVFNLPPGASVSRFAMYVTPNQLMEGELIERKQAVQVYESIVRQRRDPAILEQIGDNLFKMRVFPIFPEETKRILLDFTLPLESVSGECRFELPLLSDLKPIWDFRLSGMIAGSAKAGSIASDSHPELVVQPLEDRSGAATFEFARQNYEPQHNFSIRFQQGAEEPIRVHSFVAEALPPHLYATAPQPDSPADPWEGKAATYFLAAIPPEAAQVKRGASSPADVLILADTSSGIQSTAALRPALRSILHNLPEQARFRLACIDTGTRFLSNEWEAVEKEAVNAALARFDREFCLGGTNLAVGFQEALKAFSPEDAERRRIVIYLGDGADNLSGLSAELLKTRLVELLNAARSPLILLMVRDSEPGHRLLERVARGTGGHLLNLAGRTQGAGDLFEWLLSGLPTPTQITAVSAEGVDPQDLLFPGSLQEGRTLYVLGRAANLERLQLKVTTSTNGAPQTRTFDVRVKPQPKDMFVGRLWARRKLSKLQETDLVAPERIVALAREWSLMTPQTAFLVLEKEQDYVTWKVDRKQRRKLWES